MLLLLQYLIYIPIVLPFVVANAFGYPLAEKVGLTAQSMPTLVIVGYAIGIICAIAILYRRLRANKLSWSALGFKRFQTRKAILYFIGFYAIMFGLLLIVAVAAFVISGGDGTSDVARAKRQISTIGLWPFFMTSVIVAPIIEEVIFRGILFKTFMQKHGLAFSIIASGLLFAIFHVNPIHALAVLPIGFYLSFMYYKLDSIIPGILLHASWNLLVMSVSASAI